MKIREIRVQNFRNFGPELRSVKFYDEATGLVRPISVLVGSNGCGKTTLLELARDLISTAIRRPLTPESLEGLAKLAYQRDAEAALLLALDESEGTDELREPFWIGVSAQGPAGRRDVLWCRTRKRRVGELVPGVGFEFGNWVDRVVKGEEAEFRGGLLYFPHYRWMEHVQRGAIEEPGHSLYWLYTFNPESKWEGSLSQLWVWQNYLDLEQGREGRPNLAPFVETIEEILGRGRKVKIKEGRVRIERPDLGDAVELHELPSGEQQILNIFGEIIRMLRPGAVILIDEVELSLHPALQRAVLFHLRRLAAKYDLQVIMTTHSMEIVSAVAPEEVINLDDMAIVEQARAAGGA